MVNLARRRTRKRKILNQKEDDSLKQMVPTGSFLTKMQKAIFIIEQISEIEALKISMEMLSLTL